MRHRVVYDYVHLDLRILWQVVHEHLPPLIAYLETIVPADEPRPEE